MITHVTEGVTAISTKFVSNSIQITELKQLFFLAKIRSSKMFLVVFPQLSTETCLLSSIRIQVQYQRAIKKYNMSGQQQSMIVHITQRSWQLTPRQPQTTVRSTAAIYQTCQEQPEENNTSCAQYISIKLPYALCCLYDVYNILHCFHSHGSTLYQHYNASCLKVLFVQV